MIESSSVLSIPQSDVFWDARSWYWVDIAKSVCENTGHNRIHDAIVDAIRNGYEIRSVRGSRGSVQVKGLYK